MIKGLLGNSRRFFFNLLDTPGIILLYHRVTNPENDPQQLCVTPDNFYEQVNFLKKEYTLLEIGEFTDLFVNRKKLPKNSVILTFDDGYADNFTDALPILESLSAQALFYIATAHIDTTKEFWWDELERIFLKNNALPEAINISKGEKKISFTLTTMNDRFHVYQELHPILKYSFTDERDKITENLIQQAGLPKNGRPSHRLMCTEELKSLSLSPSALIGAHTHRHPCLSLLNYIDQLEEISKSKVILERITGKKIEHFSYPYGSKTDYNKATVEICKKLGFKMVCSNYYGQVHKWTNVFQVPRVLVRNWNKNEFKEKMKIYFSY